MAYEYFIFDLNCIEHPMKRMETLLINHYAKQKICPKIITNGKYLNLEFADYKFYLTYIEEDWVILESKDIADSFSKHREDKEKIANCTSRIEFYGEEDFNMDYFNESLFIIETIIENNFLVFDTVQCVWL